MAAPVSVVEVGASTAEIINAVIEENPYTRYTYPAQNDAVERDRAQRYARMIATEVAKRVQL